MARMRSLKVEFFTDEVLTSLPPLHRILFEGLWCHADRMGRLEDKPRELKIKILPFDDGADVDAMLTELHRLGRIVRYTAQHRGETLRLIWICHFLEHQRPHRDEKPSYLPAHDDKTAELFNAQGLLVADSLPTRGSLVVDFEQPEVSAKSKRLVLDHGSLILGSGSLVTDPEDLPAAPGAVGDKNQKQLIDEDPRKKPKPRSPSQWQKIWEEMRRTRRERLYDLDVVGDPDEAEDEQVTPALLNAGLKRVYEQLSGIEESMVMAPEDLLSVWGQYLRSNFGAGMEPAFKFSAFTSEKVARLCYEDWCREFDEERRALSGEGIG